ncbi:MAG: hypothetical protein J5983_06325 [Ruminococcus sp.]|nr:hypothetical protein [Ruminococcus sp.]
MASRYTSTYGTSYRRTYGTGNSGTRQMYVYGNTAYQADVMPQRVPEYQPERKNKTSRQVRKNRNRALSISPSYAGFLVIAAVVAVFICVSYLQLQSEIVNRSENITALQEELVALTEANDSAYQAAEDSVNLETVRNIAVNELGMVYAAQGRVTEYSSPESSYVKQYNEIPQDGVLAKSANVSQE